jgi:hypothetical protein
MKNKKFNNSNFLIADMIGKMISAKITKNEYSQPLNTHEIVFNNAIFLIGTTVSYLEMDDLCKNYKG